MGELINANSFSGKNTVVVARWLIGKVLVRGEPGQPLSRHVITETEAYHSEQDLACHASKGRTARTDVLYRAAGIWYVYLCYGIHEMLNLVVGAEGIPAAILIRGVHDAVGPGRLTKALQIGRSLNCQPAVPTSGLWLEDDGLRIPRTQVEATPRVGVDYAGPIWAAKPWRFVLTAEGMQEVRKRCEGAQRVRKCESQKV